MDSEKQINQAIIAYLKSRFIIPILIYSSNVHSSWGWNRQMQEPGTWVSYEGSRTQKLELTSAASWHISQKLSRSLDLNQALSHGIQVVSHTAPNPGTSQRLPPHSFSRLCWLFRVMYCSLHI